MDKKAADRLELKRVFTYILIAGLVFWWPLVYFVTGLPTPFALFTQLSDFGAALMFVTGANIASATAVGGGIVFNPTLQLVFGVSGYSALILAVLVQCAGMTSGCYGWYRKGEFAGIYRPHLAVAAAVTFFATAVWSVVFLLVMPLLPQTLPIIMKLASTLVSFYVARLVWLDIKEREVHIEKLERAAEEGNTEAAMREALELARADHGPKVAADPVKMDRRIWGWLILGSLLNVYTAVGAGQLLFAHLIKYFKTPPKTAVAMGAMVQAISVLTQSVFILVFMREFILVHLVCIGLFFCMVGGRTAPYVLTRPLIEPWVKHVLALTALAMGLTSGGMLLVSFL
ncbi:MAG: hypothetical protein QNK37_31910 [Acidobacteriota bacterium]|nr:hypothetical protein [Acidobacteriota bacterium]